MDELDALAESEELDESDEMDVGRVGRIGRIGYAYGLEWNWMEFVGIRWGGPLIGKPTGAGHASTCCGPAIRKPR
eukprot:11212806-Lingulodinium_polyedra.AAC.1